MNKDNHEKSVLGIDLGSRNVKICLMKESVLIQTACIDTMQFYREFGVNSPKGFHVDFIKLGFPDFANVIATGYGRSAAAISGAENISELSAHSLGARFQTGLDDYTLLDMGGQDYKVMRILKGRIVDMATNDKCAASTGRYLENMSTVLGITTEDMGRYYENPIDLSATCAIFGESELIGLVVKGKTVPHLAAGVNKSVVERVMPLLERLGGDIIVMTGGVALNKAVVRIVGDMTGTPVKTVAHPMLNGAIGCCVKGGAEITKP